MYGTYDFVNYNNTNTVTNGIGNSLTGIDTDQSLPTSAPTRALFQSTDIKLQDVCIVSFNLVRECIRLTL
jgi:hypothetical protein